MGNVGSFFSYSAREQKQYVLGALLVENLRLGVNGSAVFEHGGVVARGEHFDVAGAAVCADQVSLLLLVVA